MSKTEHPKPTKTGAPEPPKASRASQPAPAPEPPKMTIAAKLAALDQTVDWFYGDEFTLDTALAQYQAAAKLATEIRDDLAELKNQVEEVADFANES